jgi:hypothetical protein
MVRVLGYAPGSRDATASKAKAGPAKARKVGSSSSAAAGSAQSAQVLGTRKRPRPTVRSAADQTPVSSSGGSEGEGR